MKNFLRIVMFLIIATAVAGTTIFLTKQNDNYATNNPEQISSGDIEEVNNNIEVPEISGEISGELNVSGEDFELEGDVSGEQVEISGDETENPSEVTSGETLEEISGEVSGEVSGEIRNNEELVA